MKIYVIGRNPIAGTGETPIIIDDSTNTISRTHCRITQIDDNSFFIEDAGSKNGTIVNDSKIGNSIRLTPDDKISLSNKITFSVKDIQSGVPLKVTSKEQSPNEKINDSANNNQYVDREISNNKIDAKPPNPKSNNVSPKNPSLKRTNPKKNASLKSQVSGLPELQEILPAFSGTSIATLNSGILIAGLTAILLGVMAIHKISDINKHTGSDLIGNLFNASGNSNEKWEHYDDGVVYFEYPQSWIISHPYGTHVTVQKLSIDTITFAVVFNYCMDGENSDHQNIIDCSIIEFFKTDPKAFLLIGIQKDMKTYNPNQKINSKINWETAYYSGPAFSFDQLIQNFSYNLESRAKDFTKKPPESRQEPVKRNYFVANAAAMIDTDLMVSAGLTSIDNEDELMYSYFLRMMNSLKIHN
jgi:pSer/pThr/pTyr-binding forkhead associated (FHA) protein